MLPPSTGYNLVTVSTILVWQVCEEQANVFEILEQFFNFLEGAGKFWKTGDGTVFYFGLSIFPKKNYAFLKKKMWEKEKKKGKKKE